MVQPPALTRLFLLTPVAERLKLADTATPLGCLRSRRYSWLIETLVASVYGGGFVVMTPQLFINYRLKSVAHLPWKFFMCALCTRPSCWPLPRPICVSDLPFCHSSPYTYASQVQSSQHFHRRPFRVHHQDANSCTACLAFGMTSSSWSSSIRGGSTASTRAE